MSNSRGAIMVVCTDNYLTFVREGDVIGLMSERGAMRGLNRRIIGLMNRRGQKEPGNLEILIGVEL